LIWVIEPSGIYKFIRYLPHTLFRPRLDHWSPDLLPEYITYSIVPTTTLTTVISDNHYRDISFDRTV